MAKKPADSQRAALSRHRQPAGGAHPAPAPTPTAAKPVPVVNEVAAPKAAAAVPAGALAPARNWGLNMAMTGGLMQLARSRAEVRYVLQVARAAGEGVLAMGTTHSSSPVVQSSGRLLDTGLLAGTSEPTGEMREVARLRAEWYRLNPQQRARHLAVGSGVRVAELMATLDGLGLAPEMIGAYTGQTFVGATCTGTHGSGLGHGPLHTAIRSIQLTGIQADGTVKEYRIEPAGGITVKAAYENENNEVKLIQNDEVFQSVLVSFGCMGVITSVIVELLPAYNLVRTSKFFFWDDLKARLTQVDASGNPTLFDGTWSANVLMNPYNLLIHKEKGQKCVVSRIRADPPPPGSVPAKDSKMSDALGSVAKAIMNAGLAPDALEIAVNIVHHPKPEFGSSHEVMGSTGDIPPGYSVEYAFPADNWVPVMDRMLAEVAAQAKKNNFLGGTVSIRYVKGDAALLSMAHGRDSVFIEFLTLAGVKGAQEVFAALEPIALAGGGRPHWGQWWSMERLPAIVATCPGFQTWKQTMLCLDPTGFFGGKTGKALRLL